MSTLTTSAVDAVIVPSIQEKILDFARKKAKQHSEKIEENPATQRVNHYIALIVKADIEGLLEVLLEDMDKEKILAEVREAQQKNPNSSPEELANKEITSIARAMSGVAIGAGLSWVIPGVALLTGALATAGEIIGLFVFQSRLVVKIAAFYGLNISLKDRVRDVMVCVACSSTSIAGAKLAGKALDLAIKKFAEQMARMTANKMVQAGIKSIPFFGGLAGVISGATGALSNYYAVKGVGSYALKMYGGDSVLLAHEVNDTFEKTMIAVAILVAQADGKITDEEGQLIESLVQDSELTEESKREFLAGMNRQMKVADIQVAFSEDEKKQLINLSLKIIIIDGNLESNELKVIYDLANHLAISREYVDQKMEQGLQTGI